MKFTRYCDNIFKTLLETVITQPDDNEITLDYGAQLAIDIILETKKNNHKIMIIGNGGSAAIAGHMQNDLSKAVGVRAMAFTDIPLITALANDDGYSSVYEKPVIQWAEAGDVLVAISSSGNSENILKAARAAKKCDCSLITLTGFGPDNALRKSGDLNFYMPVNDYGLVESAHAILSHYITDQAMAKNK
jgi:D-sedoheptulose 7-phosphate isomerase